MPAVAWWGYGIAITVLVVLLGGMYALVKVMSDDSGKYEEIRAMMDPLFHTPSFLRPGAEPDNGSSSRDEAAAGRMAVLEPFEDTCPGCREPVTHEHAECPSCGLRLM